jgi:F0F1-type ATP synthase assembly protein I
MNRLPPTVRLIGIGWYFAICIVAGLVGGFFLDNVAGTTPLLTILGLLLALVVAFYGMYRMLTEVLASQRADKEKTEE